MGILVGLALSALSCLCVDVFVGMWSENAKTAGPWHTNNATQKNKLSFSLLTERSHCLADEHPLRRVPAEEVGCVGGGHYMPRTACPSRLHTRRKNLIACPRPG